MTDRSRVLIGRSMAALGFGSAIVGVTWSLLLGAREVLWLDWVIQNGLVATGSSVIAWLVVKPQPRNGESWVFAWTGVFTGLLCLLYALALFLGNRYEVGLPVFDMVPGQVPTALALVLMNANWLWMGIFLPFTLGLVLFPDGRPPSPGWRWVNRTSIAVIALTCLGLAWEARPSTMRPIAATQDTNGGFESFTSSIVTLGYPLTFALILVSLAALVARFRRSSGLERQQFKWVVWGSAVAGFLVVLALILDEVADLLAVATIVGGVAMVILLVAFGAAITRYRIYDIDLVISRTFVYGALGGFITVLYVAIVVGVGSLLGGGDEPNPLLAVVATALVAIAFQPMRRALNRVANRLVYGKKSSHYEVLSEFSRHVAAADDTITEQVARSLVDGTTAESAAIWIAADENLVLAAEWPTGSAPDSPSDATIWSPVMQGAEELGRLSLSLPAGESADPTDQRLLDQMASGMGLALRNLRLTEDLKRRVEDLRESRRRIVAVQDETRKKLERDLHDGAQQHLVALKVKMGLARQIANKRGASRTVSILEPLASETDGAIESMRDFARGIYPPLLEAEGLRSALGSQLRKLPIEVELEVGEVGRYGAETESSVYFCVLEALQNVTKHAAADRVTVRLGEANGSLSFSVQDDGTGFDASAEGSNHRSAEGSQIRSAEGSGLVNLADRIDSVGGVLNVVSKRGEGTLVEGSIPIAMAGVS